MLWKNAFDATENVPVGRRMVEVRIQEFQEQLVISIDNSCNNDIVIIDNLPQASRTGHGYNQKSIQSIAKVHGGMALFQVKEEIFLPDGNHSTAQYYCLIAECR